jgi:hypothetical protein
MKISNIYKKILCENIKKCKYKSIEDFLIKKSITKSKTDKKKIFEKAKSSYVVENITEKIDPHEGIYTFLNK